MGKEGGDRAGSANWIAAMSNRVRSGRDVGSQRDARNGFARFPSETQPEVLGPSHFNTLTAQTAPSPTGVTSTATDEGKRHGGPSRIPAQVASPDENESRGDLSASSHPKNKLEYSVPTAITVETQTNFSRGRGLLKLIDSSLQSTSYPEPSILIVGLGMASHMLLGSSEPQKVAAHLEARGITSQLTLLDVSHEVIEDVRTRKTLYINPYGDKTYKRLVGEELDSYLADTGQPKRVIQSPEAGLKFNKNQVEPGYAEKCLMAGVWAADVPESFHTRIATGAIQLLEADVAHADLSGSQPFDFAEMTNLFWLLTREQQMLALENVAGHMKDGGKILVNDQRSPYASPPVFSQLGGWLTEERLKALNLRIETVLDQNPRAMECILTKI